MRRYVQRYGRRRYLHVAVFEDNLLDDDLDDALHLHLDHPVLVDVPLDDPLDRHLVRGGVRVRGEG